MRKGPLMVSILLLAGASVIAATPSQHVPVEESLCWQCHAPGLWSPAMEGPRLQEMFFEQRNGEWWLVAEISNPWLHELRYVNGVMEGASALRLRTVDVPAITGTLAGSPLPQPMMAVHEFQVPDHMHGLEATLTYESLTPYNLDLRIIDAEETLIGDIDEGGTGDADVITISAHEAATAPGPWSIIVSTDAGIPEDIEYTITFVQQGGMVARGMSAAPNGTATVAWPVDGAHDVENLTTVTFYHDMYYEHEPGTEDADLDFGRFMAAPQIGSFDGQPYFVEVEEPEQEDDAFVPGPGILAVPVLAVAAGLRRR